MVGKTLGHYRILEKIGAGGMGEVYRARDEHLGRDVAIKVLPAGTLADEASRKRFRKEALALSKLNHPNIETVHDFDTQDGVDFLVMEHIPGVTLSDKLASGPLPEKEIGRLGAQLAEALEAAHKEHVIHRDIKPGNLRLTPEGRLKVLDFGLAKLVRPPTATATTESFSETQAAAGTLPYMAPEQLRGEPADARTDLYAAGVVLYEMATGRRPFEARLSTALAADIQHKPPPPPGRLKPDLSARLEELILKCLEKDPEHRYQSAKELLVDLRRLAAPTAPSITPSPQAPAWGRRIVVAVVGLVVLAVAGYFAWQQLQPKATPPEGKIMLAVLPFDNLSGDPEQEYFSDGLTEEMIAQLGGLQPDRLGVIARTSAMHYKGTNKRLDEIGRELGVEYILEGSVRREADRVRITAQLIQVSDQTHLWAENYQHNLEDIFAVQSDVAQRVARSLAVELLTSQQARLAEARPLNPQAYEAYLRGRYFWNRRGREALMKSLEYFQRAIEIDPTYAPAYAGVADSWAVLANNGHLPAEETFPKAKAAAQKALAIDDSLPEAHASLGFVLWNHDWDWVGAEMELRRALQLNPNYATAHHWYAALLSILGRHEEAIAEVKRARELDPLSLRINANVGLILYWARRYDEAILEIHKALELDPNQRAPHEYLGYAYLVKGMHDEAISELQKAADLAGSVRLMNPAEIAYANAVAGRRDEARKMLDDLLARSEEQFLSPVVIALVYVGLEENDIAIEWLEKGYATRDARMYEVKVEPFFDPLRDDPRFQDLLRRMNFPEN